MPPRALLFDLGGVLVHWDGIAPLVRLCPATVDHETIRRFWLESPWVRTFERGRCTPREFALGVIAELDLALAPDEFLGRFLAWDRGPFPGALELLDALRSRFTVACLSNNNPLHWSKIRDAYDFGRRFDRSYLSHEIGAVKPDAAAFEHVLVDLAIPPAEILFFDDNPECVEAARALGMSADQVSGVDGVIEALAARGISP